MIAVIGGTGKVGSALLPELARRRLRTRALVRHEGKAQRVAMLGVDPFVGDLRDTDVLARLFSGASAVFLLTPPSPDEGAVKSGVIDAARRAGVRTIVLLSGAGANALSPISQAREHAAAESSVRSSGMSYTILQPYFFMQNYLDQAGTIKGNFGNDIRSQGAIFGNFGGGRLAMVDTRDIAAVAAACLSESGHAGRTYALTGGDAITSAAAAATLTTVTGRPIEYVNLPSAEVVAGMTAAGVPDWLANDLALLGEEIAAGKFARTTDVVERVTGRPPISFDRFARDHATAFSNTQD